MTNRRRGWNREPPVLRPSSWLEPLHSTPYDRMAESTILPDPHFDHHPVPRDTCLHCARLPVDDHPLADRDMERHQPSSRSSRPRREAHRDTIQDSQVPAIYQDRTAGNRVHDTQREPTRGPRVLEPRHGRIESHRVREVDNTERATQQRSAVGPVVVHYPNDHPEEDYGIREVDETERGLQRISLVGPGVVHFHDHSEDHSIRETKKSEHEVHTEARKIQNKKISNRKAVLDNDSNQMGHYVNRHTDEGHPAHNVQNDENERHFGQHRQGRKRNSQEARTEAEITPRGFIDAQQDATSNPMPLRIPRWHGEDHGFIMPPLPPRPSDLPPRPCDSPRAILDWTPPSLTREESAFLHRRLQEDVVSATNVAFEALEKATDVTMAALEAHNAALNSQSHSEHHHCEHGSRQHSCCGGSFTHVSHRDAGSDGAVEINSNLSNESFVDVSLKKEPRDHRTPEAFPGQEDTTEDDWEFIDAEEAKGAPVAELRDHGRQGWLEWAGKPWKRYY